MTQKKQHSQCQQLTMCIPTLCSFHQQRKKKEGHGMTFDIIMAYLLLGFNFFMQGFLLWVIYNEVVTGNIEWQASIARKEGGGLDLMNLEPDVGKCNPGGSLCFMENETYSCAPPSVQL